MDVFISADIEGCSGITTWAQCGSIESGSEYVWARQMMTQDVNAAIRGARKAGANRIVVKDSHNNGRNLLARDLEPGVELISGCGCDGLHGMMEGIDDSFDLCFLVGYHARAGTTHGILCHTISGRVHRLSVNEKEIGEIGISAGLAGRYQVPTSLVVSDLAGCQEATDLLGSMETVAVKDGLGRYIGSLKHPLDNAVRIEAAASAALQNVDQHQPLQLPSPYRLVVEFKREEECDYAARYPGTKRRDAYTVTFEENDFLELHRAIRNILVFGDLGGRSNG